MTRRGPALVEAAAARANRTKTDAAMPAEVPLTPALAALLSYDREWLPAFKRKPKRERTSAIIARALKKLKVANADASMFDTLYPGECIQLTNPQVAAGNVEVTFLYLALTVDEEYPILTYFQPEDAPGEIVIIAPGIDVWLARREGVIDGPAGAPSFGLPQPYAAALQAQADVNFDGCWAHEFSDVVERHGDFDVCRSLEGERAKLGRDLIFRAEHAWYLKLADVLATFRADAYRNWIGSGQEYGSVYVKATAPERVETGFVYEVSPLRLVPPGAPADDPRGCWLLAKCDNDVPKEVLAIRLETTPQTDRELVGTVARALVTRLGFWAEVGKYRWHRWSVHNPTPLTTDDLDAWFARYSS